MLELMRASTMLPPIVVVKLLVIFIEDPYQDVFFTKCNRREDDNFLLFCDLCDSAAHTYGVGLKNFLIPT